MSDGGNSETIRKLEEEIRLERAKAALLRAQRPWWRSFSITAPFATIVAAFGAVVAVWLPHHFDQETISLEKRLSEAEHSKNYIEMYSKRVTAYYRLSIKYLINDIGVGGMKRVPVPAHIRAFCEGGSSWIAEPLDAHGSLPTGVDTLKTYLRNLKFDAPFISPLASRTLDATRKDVFDFLEKNDFKSIEVMFKKFEDDYKLYDTLLDRAAFMNEDQRNFVCSSQYDDNDKSYEANDVRRVYDDVVNTRIEISQFYGGFVAALRGQFEQLTDEQIAQPSPE